MKTGDGASSFTATRRGTRRRDLLVGAATVLSRRAAAQEAPKSAHIGFIVTGEVFPSRDFFVAMRQLGWIEGHSLVVERRMTGEDQERRKTAAAELIAAKPDVIVELAAEDRHTGYVAGRARQAVGKPGFYEIDIGNHHDWYRARQGVHRHRVDRAGGAEEHRSAKRGRCPKWGGSFDDLAGAVEDRSTQAAPLPVGRRNARRRPFQSWRPRTT
jgi:hypothetical protein